MDFEQNFYSVTDFQQVNDPFCEKAAIKETQNSSSPNQITFTNLEDEENLNERIFLLGCNLDHEQSLEDQLIPNFQYWRQDPFNEDVSKIDYKTKRKIKGCSFINFMRNALENFGKMHNFLPYLQGYHNSNDKKSKSYLLIFSVLLQQQSHDHHRLGEKFLETMRQKYPNIQEFKTAFKEEMSNQFYLCLWREYTNFLEYYENYCRKPQIKLFVQSAYQLVSAKGSKSYGKIKKSVCETLKKITSFEEK